MSETPVIVCASDFSPPSDRALDTAVSYAQLLGASVELVHVFQAPWFTWPDVSIAEKLGLTVEDGVSVSDWVEQDAKRSLEERLSSHAGGAVPVHGRIVHGSSVHKAIIEAARERDALLLVLGTLGRGGASRVLIGSVAERVVRTAPIPVLTVPGPAS